MTITLHQNMLHVLYLILQMSGLKVRKFGSVLVLNYLLIQNLILMQ